MFFYNNKGIPITQNAPLLIKIHYYLRKSNTLIIAR